MLAEPAQRFRQIVSDQERPGGDDGELLHRGHVISLDGGGSEARRAELRPQARRDKFRVLTVRDGDRAIAARNLDAVRGQAPGGLGMPVACSRCT